MENRGELYFENPLFNVGFLARFWVRSLKSAIYIFLAATAFIVVFSDIEWLRWMGWVIIVFFVWRLLLRIINLRKKNFRGGNLYMYMTPKARKVLEAGYDRASIMKGSLVLNMLRELVDTYEVEDVLRKLGVGREEFVTRLDQYLKDEAGFKETNTWKRNRVEEVVVKALTTQEGERTPINTLDLFRALSHIEHERLSRLFSMFEIDRVALERASRYYSY